MNEKLVGALAGLTFGLVLFWKGPGEAFAVLFFVLLGWFVGKLIRGEVNMVGYMERLSNRRSRE